jgi:fibronectin type 3 domain-containing protein/regulation of enolase protein 1 (concanavalin A-like superfamily)
MSGGWGSGFSLVLDVTGFNYSLGSVDWYHSTYSTSNIIGTETSSQVTDRGIYTNDAVNGYVWGYDLNPVPWGETAEAWWQFYYARPWSSGGFCWTGFDYRGEPTPYGWPCINSHFGILDTCGFPKDIFYYYQANWTLKPVLHILPHWNWAGKEGQPISVWVFGNCDLVDLFLNGVSQGQQALNTQGHAAWSVPYAAGTLQSVGYRNGQAVVTNTVQTTGVPAAVALIPDRTTILADDRDVSVVTVAVLDSLGRVVPTATNLINFTVSGGAIIGVGNGNPSSHEADKAGQRSVFNGLAQVIVQSTNQTGSISLTAASTGLTPTNITITAAATLPAPAAPVGVAVIATNQQNVVSWDVVPGAITYNLKRSTTSGGPYSIIASNTAAIGFTDTAVTNLVTYYYVASAVNANGESVNSSPASGTPQLPPVPTVPTGVTATRGDTQVTLIWTGASGATSYNVKRGTSSGTYPTVTNVTTTSLVITGLANGTPYYFVVSALNPTGESGNSSEVIATPMAFVSGLAAAIVNSQVQLQWNAHAGATGYNVKQALVSGGPYTLIASNLATTTFTDSAVDSCQTYYYVVTMMTGAVESVPSAEASATVPGLLPPPLQSADVGSVTPAGSSSFCSGQYVIAGSGADIWDVADAFQFAYVYVPGSTNCEIRARVVSLDYTHSNAKAAVMIRESLAANSRHALADVEPGSGIEFLWRTNTGNGTSSISTPGTAPNWVRLTRTNNTFTASWSPDGNAWSQIGSSSITMSNGAYVGLAVCSHDNGTLCSAVFDNVYISGIATASSPVIVQQPAGGTRYAGGAITLSATFSGSTPLSYQWQRNGTPVAGGSSGGLTLSLPLTGLTTGQAGDYTLSVTNSYGHTNTTAATVTVLPLTPGSYAEMIATNNPVSYWRLNETGTPATAYDFVGGNNLANTSVVSTQGVQGFGYETTNTAAYYNGTSSGSSGSAPLMNTMTKFTICGWFKAVSMPQPQRTALFGQNDLAEFGFHNLGTGSSLGIWVAGPVAGGILVTNPTAILIPNTWYFVAATADGTNINLYLNGSLLKSLPGTVTNYYNSTDPFRIGSGVLDSSGNYFNGAIDEVALFNRALTPGQLQVLYQVAFAPPNVVMTIQPIGTNVTLVWSPAVGTLQSATNVTGIYSNVLNATPPYTNPISGPQKFFRVWVQ